MPAPKNFSEVAALKEKVHEAHAVFVAEYRGMTVKQISALRRKLREVGAEFKVTKNTLMAIAMKDEGKPDLSDMMAGPNGYVMAYKDPAAAAKVVRDYEKDSKMFILKGGYISSKLLSVDNVKALADLPPREALLSAVVGTIAAPIRGLVTVLGGPVRGFMTCLGQIKENKEKESTQA